MLKRLLNQTARRVLSPNTPPCSLAARGGGPVWRHPPLIRLFASQRSARPATPAASWPRLAPWVALLVVIAMLAPALAAAEGANRYLYLVRHGAYDYEDERPADVGKALVPLGIAQARLVASRLRGMPVEMTALYTSTLTRARQTALVIGEDFPDLELRLSPMLCECTPPTWNERVMEDVDPSEAAACSEQLEKAFTELFVPATGDDDKHEIVVCHGNVIRYLVTKVLGVDTESWLQMSVAHCSITLVRVNPDGTFKLLSVGDVGHIPPNMQSGVDRVDRRLEIPSEKGVGK